MSEQFKSAAKNLIEKEFNRKDISALEAYFSSRLEDHALPPGVPEGFEGRKLFYSAFLAAFPDIHVHIKIYSPRATSSSSAGRRMTHIMAS